MSPDSDFIKNTSLWKIFLTLSILAFFFWLSGYIFNIYKFALIGAVFEIVWLPMLAILFFLPVAAFIFWRRDKFVIRSYFLSSITISVITMALLLFFK
jgi:hypothetical protein